MFAFQTNVLRAAGMFCVAQSLYGRASAGLSAVITKDWAKKRSDRESCVFELHAVGERDQSGTYVKEPATWSISAPQSDDPAKAVAMGFLLLPFLSWVWSAMRLSKTSSGHHTVTAPLCPNRKVRKPQANTTHVTLSLRGGCNYAAAFCASWVRNAAFNNFQKFEVSTC